MEMKPVAIILTHGHYDHIGAVNALKERYGIKVYVSEAEKELIGDKKMNLSSYFDSPMTIEADEFLKDGQKITLAGINMTFIATPDIHQAADVIIWKTMKSYLAVIHYSTEAEEEQIFRWKRI